MVTIPLSNSDLPPAGVDDHPEEDGDDQAGQVASYQVGLVGSKVGLGALEHLGQVGDEDEQVVGDAEAVPDQPEDKVDPGLGPDPVDEQAAGGDAHDGQGHPETPGDRDHHRLDVLLVHHHQSEASHQCVDEEEEVDNVAGEADPCDDQASCP